MSAFLLSNHCLVLSLIDSNDVLVWWTSSSAQSKDEDWEASIVTASDRGMLGNILSRI